MPEILYIFWYNFTFWLTIGIDVLILTSVIFSLLYAAFLPAASLPPFRGKIRPNAWALPVMLAAAMALVFSPAGQFAAMSISLGFERLYVNNGEWKQYVVVGLWVLGFAVSLAALIGRSRNIGRTLNSLDEAPADAAFEEAGACLGLKNVKLKELREGGAGLSPFSWGLFRRYIGVPPRFAAHFGYGERYAIYLHELTHLTNRDSWKYLLIGVLKALFWFNPIVALALARYKNHLEISCDRALIHRHGLNPMEYSRLMLRAVSGDGAGVAPGFSAAFGDLSRRLGYIFGDAQIIPVRKDRLLSILCLALAALGLFCLNPELKALPEAPPPPEKILTRPDGTKVRISCVFQWQGSLGGYTIAQDRPLE